MDMLSSVQQAAELKSRLSQSIQSFLTDSIGAEITPSMLSLTLESALKNWSEDWVRIAVVGEVSRGKSHIVNALFFKNIHNYFLPVGSGVTNTFPIVIRSMSKTKQIALGTNSFLSLLPMSTKSKLDTVQQLKKKKETWFRQSIETEKPQSDMQVIMKKDCVDIQYARSIGLCPPMNTLKGEEKKFACPSCGLGMVEIPKWRYGELEVSSDKFPDGLEVVDTPGLNSIGSDPAVALNCIKDMHCILFVLSSEQGATDTDKDIWDKYIVQPGLDDRAIVVLNKKDLIWNELKDPFEAEEEQQTLIKNTSNRLEIPEERIVFFSAKEALLGKIKGIEEKIEDSGYEVLSDKIQSMIQKFWVKKGLSEVYSAVREVQDVRVKVLYKEERVISGSIAQVMEIKQQAEKNLPSLIESYENKIKNIKDEHEFFEEQKKKLSQTMEEHLISHLDIQTYDEKVAKVQRDIGTAWTTPHIIKYLGKFFENIIENFNHLVEGVDTVNNHLDNLYKELNNKYGLEKPEYTPYLLFSRRTKIIELAEEYGQINGMLRVAMSSQSSIVENTFYQISSNIREEIILSKNELLGWVSQTISDMEKQVLALKNNLSKELESLNAIKVSTDQMEKQLATLQSELDTVKGHMQHVEQHQILLEEIKKQLEI